MRVCVRDLKMQRRGGWRRREVKGKKKRKTPQLLSLVVANSFSLPLLSFALASPLPRGLGSRARLSPPCSRDARRQAHRQRQTDKSSEKGTKGGAKKNALRFIMGVPTPLLAALGGESSRSSSSFACSMHSLRSPFGGVERCRRAREEEEEDRRRVLLRCN